MVGNGGTYVPDSWFLLRLIISSADKLPISLGMLPVKYVHACQQERRGKKNKRDDYYKIACVCVCIYIYKQNLSHTVYL